MGTVAILFSVALIVIAIKVDLDAKKRSISWAELVPMLWLSINLSRNPSRWLNIGKIQMLRNENYVNLLEKGNVSDQIFFSIMLVFAFLILLGEKRKVLSIIRDNKVWVLLVLYCMFSVARSDYLYISLKRFVKDLNAYVMVLVILSQSDPFESFKTIVRWTVYILIPLSVTFCKYFPSIGRSQTSSWDFIYTGVATHKNELGVLCLIAVMILLVEIYPYLRNRNEKLKMSKLFLSICLIYASMSLYLLNLANSMTVNICLLLLIMMVMSKFLNKHMIKLAVAIAVLYLLILNEQINEIGSEFFNLIGRNRTFTGRTILWEAVLNMKFDHLFGAGYSAFWLGERMRDLIERFIFVPKQAHNGFIEVYINLGLIGVSIFIAALYTTYKKLVSSLSEDQYRVSFGIAFLTMYIVHNVTEATFIFNSSPLWFIFLYVALSEKKRYSEMQVLSSKFTKVHTHLVRA